MFFVEGYLSILMRIVPRVYCRVYYSSSNYVNSSSPSGGASRGWTSRGGDHTGSILLTSTDRHFVSRAYGRYKWTRLRGRRSGDSRCVRWGWFIVPASVAPGRERFSAPALVRAVLRVFSGGGGLLLFFL